MALKMSLAHMQNTLFKRETRPWALCSDGIIFMVNHLVIPIFKCPPLLGFHYIGDTVLGLDEFLIHNGTL